MKKLIPTVAAVAVAASMTLWQGCGTEEDPDALNADSEEEALDDPDPDADLDNKGEKNFKPKKKDDLPDGDDDGGADE